MQRMYFSIHPFKMKKLFVQKKYVLNLLFLLRLQFLQKMVRKVNKACVFFDAWWWQSGFNQLIQSSAVNQVITRERTNFVFEVKSNSTTIYDLSQKNCNNGFTSASNNHNQIQQSPNCPTTLNFLHFATNLSLPCYGFTIHKVQVSENFHLC